MKSSFLSVIRDYTNIHVYTKIYLEVRDIKKTTTTKINIKTSIAILPKIYPGTNIF